MTNKLIILYAALLLSSCSYFQKPELIISPNQWSGKKIYFVNLDDDFKQTRNFNRIWSKLHKENNFRPYHTFSKRLFTIIGKYNNQKIDYLVIENEKGHQFKMKFNFGESDLPKFPSYILFDSILLKANALIGKTIWLNNTGDYNGFYSFADYDFSRFESVTVIDVHQFQNRNFDHPVWLKVKANNGLEGFVRYNGENKKIGTQDHYYTINPLPDKWGNETIQKIIKRQVEVGMTNEQVRNSIGNPDELNYTSSRHGFSEQWVYGKQIGHRVYYQFENGKLLYINQ